jgi:hypothetical protein
VLTPTAVAMALAPGARVQDVHAYMATTSLVRQWSSGPFPDVPLSQKGVYVAIFLDRNAPPGCSFPSLLGATVSGLVVVQELLGACN